MRRTGAIAERMKLYVSLQTLNIFDANNHIKSYQWTRLGVEISGTQFGLTVNVDEFEPEPEWISV